MLGPAVAVIWGWLPAMLWVVLGAVFVGCVQDFSALVVSMRAKGQSIGKVAEGVIGPRAKLLFLALIFFGVALAMGVFVYIIAKLLQAGPDFDPDHLAAAATSFPSAVLPSAALMILAMIMGYLLYRRRFPLAPTTCVGFVFTVIACGAASGFHVLVSSGTTAKQINTETDARFIGYGGMIGESLLGLTLVVATLYIHQRGRNPWFTGLPMAFMLISTFTALIENLASFLDKGQYLLLAVGSALLVVGAGIVVEGIRAFVRRQRHTDDSITFADDT